MYPRGCAGTVQGLCRDCAGAMLQSQTAILASYSIKGANFQPKGLFLVRSFSSLNHSKHCLRGLLPRNEEGHIISTGRYKGTGGNRQIIVDNHKSNAANHQKNGSKSCKLKTDAWKS